MPARYIRKSFPTVKKRDNWIKRNPHIEIINTYNCPDQTQVPLAYRYIVEIKNPAYESGPERYRRLEEHREQERKKREFLDGLASKKILGSSKDQATDQTL